MIRVARTKNTLYCTVPERSKRRRLPSAKSLNRLQIWVTQVFGHGNKARSQTGGAVLVRPGWRKSNIEPYSGPSSRRWKVKSIALHRVKPGVLQRKVTAEL